MARTRFTVSVAVKEREDVLKNGAEVLEVLGRSFDARIEEPREALKEGAFADVARSISRGAKVREQVAYVVRLVAREATRFIECHKPTSDLDN